MKQPVLQILWVDVILADILPLSIYISNTFAAFLLSNRVHSGGDGNDSKARRPMSFTPLTLPPLSGFLDICNENSAKTVSYWTALIPANV